MRICIICSAATHTQYLLLHETNRRANIIYFIVMGYVAQCLLPSLFLLTFFFFGCQVPQIFHQCEVLCWLVMSCCSDIFGSGNFQLIKVYGCVSRACVVVFTIIIMKMAIPYKDYYEFEASNKRKIQKKMKYN